MSTAELQTIEDNVLAWIRAAGQPISTSVLLEQHRDDLGGLSGESLRRAVWNLVDRGLVQYDLEWRLSAPNAGGR